MRIAVIGGGPAGLTAAYQLGKHAQSVDVYEASDSVGGLSRSMRLWGQTVDVGPHRFFSQDRRVNELWLEVVGADYKMVNRLTRILYKGRFYQYPLEPLNALQTLGAVEATRCVASFAKQKMFRRTDNAHFEGWVSARFGRRLYEIFFKRYSEKLWGIPCDELDVDFAAQRIRQFSLLAAAKQALGVNGQAKHRTLCDQFAYPIGGTGMVYSRMASAIERNGGRVLRRTPVRSVLAEGRRCVGLELEDGAVHRYDEVISSMPLTLLVQRMADMPEDLRELSTTLKYRNTILVFLEIANSDVCDDNWVYVQDPDLQTGRITNFRNWVPELHGDSPNTILAMEYWCDSDDAFWRQDDAEIARLAERELLATTLVADPDAVVNAMVHRIPRSYPVYRRGYRDILEPIQEHLKSIDGLQVIGRYGAFKYNNQDHSILMGLLAAENVLERADHDLWSVNSDYESYQESCRISESGLVSVS